MPKRKQAETKKGRKPGKKEEKKEIPEPVKKKPYVDFTPALEHLKKITIVVADTGDFNSIEKFKPEDATTNPTLILQAAKLPQYEEIIIATIKKVKEKFPEVDKKLLIEECYDHIVVAIGCEILKKIPGYVSTEVDARLSFDTESSIAKARKIIKLYEENGISKDRILIKLAATWEGIQACKTLEAENIHCNMTLIFNYYQALACAEVKATLISPFVGRILDWHKKQGKSFQPEEEPGVLSVKDIYNYYKKYDHKTIVMGASFRNAGEIIALAGCDRLTISPQLLEELTNMDIEVPKKLDAETAKTMDIEKRDMMDEKTFRWLFNLDAMAVDKLAEGIRKFAADTEECEKLIQAKLTQYPPYSSNKILLALFFLNCSSNQ